MEDLLVGADDEVVRLGEPGALVLPEQGDARGEGGRHEGGTGHRVGSFTVVWCAGGTATAEAEPSPDRLGLRLMVRVWCAGSALADADQLVGRRVRDGTERARVDRDREVDRGDVGDVDPRQGLA